ncbi:MAG: DUF6797 domain-containing protein, partial [Planctomycetota bacterium]
ESLNRLAEQVAKKGDAKRGAYVFYRPELNCARCHEIDSNVQRRLGPDLSQEREIQVEHLIESVLEPSATIKQGFSTVIIQLLSGEVLMGVLVEESTEHLVIDRIANPDELTRIDKKEIDQWKESGQSTMPAKLASQLSNRGEFLDLIAYLHAIANGGKIVADQLKPDQSLFVEAPLPDYENEIDHRGMISAWNSKSLDRGAKIFELRCASCHGSVTEAGSMPTSLRFARGNFKNGSDPYQMYQTLTHGYGMMRAQRWMVPQQKYDVIHYVREHFVRQHNPDQYFDIDIDYLKRLPTGSSRGPDPVEYRPWTVMDYGPSLNNTLEISDDGSNIAQKGIAIRLDVGPGGVESGQHWVVYDHDTMRMAASWRGDFIDYNGIHFNGVHQRHPKLASEVDFQNLPGPGWANPEDGAFGNESRTLGRDGRYYGPLPTSWLKFNGLYRFGQQTVLSYRIGDAEIDETPILKFVNGDPVVTRQIRIGPRSHELCLRVCNSKQELIQRTHNGLGLVLKGDLNLAKRQRFD